MNYSNIDTYPKKNHYIYNPGNNNIKKLLYMYGGIDNIHDNIEHEYFDFDTFCGSYIKLCTNTWIFFYYTIDSEVELDETVAKEIMEWYE